MADVMRMLTGAPALVSVPLCGLVIILTTIYASYATIARYLKWLTGVLFVYVITAFVVGPDWRQVAVATLGPSLSWDSLYVTTLVNPIRMLVLSAVLNGLLAPPLLLLVMLVSSNRAIMGMYANGPWLNLLGWSATVVMTLAAVAFFVTA